MLKRFFGKTIAVGSFSIPLWLFVLVSVAFAWGALAILSGMFTTSVSVAEPPTPVVDIIDEWCLIYAGAGTVDACVRTDGGLSAAFSGVDDTTTLKVGYRIENVYTEDVCINNLLYDDLPGFAEAASVPVSLAPGADDKIEITYTAEADLVNHAGTTLPDAGVTFEVADCP